MNLNLLLSGLALASTTALNADTILSYGGKYINGSTSNYARSATGSGSGPYSETLSFSDDDVLSPTSDYTGPTFYGGYQFSSSTVDGHFSRQQIRSGTTEDSIYLQTYKATDDGGWDGSELSLHAAYIFKKEDFLAGHTTGSNTITGLSISSNSYSAGTGRFMVEVGGSYYVSNSTFSASGTKSLILDSTALTTETWASYAPASDLNFDQTATFTALSLNNVTAVGYYIERDSWTGTTSSTPFGLGITNFEVTGTTTVPEPSSFALITGALAMACITRRKRCA
jgi:hypothetical protein